MAVSIRRRVCLVELPLLLALVAPSAWAAGQVTGTVKDDRGNPKVGMHVTLNGKSTTTTSKGTFKLQAPSEGTYQLQVGDESYNVEITAGGQMKPASFKYED